MPCIGRFVFCGVAHLQAKQAWIPRCAAFTCMRWLVRRFAALSALVQSNAIAATRIQYVHLATSRWSERQREEIT